MNETQRQLLEALAAFRAVRYSLPIWTTSKSDEAIKQNASDIIDRNLTSIEKQIKKL